MFVHITLSLGLLLFSTAAFSQSSTVSTVSPGGLQEPVQVADACPTFSWGSVPGASGYELAVFRSLDGENSSYHAQDSQGPPVLEAHIAAPALSWTPGGEDCLESDASYLWFVRAWRDSDADFWSRGRLFEVNFDQGTLADAIYDEVSAQLGEPETWRQMLSRVFSMDSSLTARLRAAKKQLGTTIAQPALVLKNPEKTVSGDTLAPRATYPSSSAFRVMDGNGVLFATPPNTVYLPSLFEYIPAEGPGSRFMWYPYKKALRAGSVSADQWDDDNIGHYSVAMGQNTTASGSNSTAMGNGTTASGNYSTSNGFNTTASGLYSTAMGVDTTASYHASTALGNGAKATGPKSTAMGSYTLASGDGATAMGLETTASGLAATSMGNETSASGDYSTAMGNKTTASGSYSIAGGLNTTASGSYSTARGLNSIASGAYSTAIGSAAFASGLNSTAIGHLVSASSYNEMVIGINNSTSGGTYNNWIPTEPLFVIGNGEPMGDPSNAMVVLKNGNTGVGISTPEVPLQVDSGDDCTPSSGGYLVVNGTNSTNVCIDSNEIIARNNGVVADLWINREGATTRIGGDSEIGGNLEVGQHLQVGDILMVGDLTTHSTDIPLCATLYGHLAYCSSSNRYKENIEPLHLGMQTIEQLEPVTFKWKDRDEPSVGFIAEQVAAIDPMLATYNKDGEIQGVKYPQLTALLVNAIQEQQKEITSLRRELELYHNLATEVAEIKLRLARSPQ